MRRLHVIHYPIYGGPHNEALRLSAPLADLGWDTTVVLPDEPGNARERLESAGVEVVSMPLGRLRAVRSPKAHLQFGLGLAPQVLAIRRLIRERQIDVVQIGGLVNPHAAIAARLEHVPLVWQIVDSRTPKTLVKAFMPMVRGLADAVMFDGESLIDIHCGQKPLKQPAIVYYPPVDTTRFQPSSDQRRRTRSEYGIPEKVPVVGMVANWNPQKGIENFVRAAGFIYRQQPDTWFLMVGATYATHTAYTSQIEAEMASSGIPRERFVTVGERSDVEAFYPAMDVKLITSVPLSEGTTTTAMEAASCGVPVVATDVGAVREVIAEERSGLVVPPLEPAALAQATLSLLTDSHMRAAMGGDARRLAVERYDVNVCAATHIDAFEQAVAHHRGRPGSTKRSPGQSESTSGEFGVEPVQSALGSEARASRR